MPDDRDQVEAAVSWSRYKPPLWVGDNWARQVQGRADQGWPVAVSPLL